MPTRWTRWFRAGVVPLALSASAGVFLAIGAALSTPAFADTLCGAPANPWGINYCDAGLPITTSNLPSGVCNVFKCIATFTNGTGYMVECKDGAVGMSGGQSGSCSDHGGEKQQASLDAKLASTTTTSPATTTTPPVATTTSPPVSTTAPPVAASGSPVASALPSALPTTGPGPALQVAAATGLGLAAVGGALLLWVVVRRRPDSHR